MIFRNAREIAYLSLLWTTVGLTLLNCSSEAFADTPNEIRCTTGVAGEQNVPHLQDNEADEKHAVMRVNIENTSTPALMPVQCRLEHTETACYVVTKWCDDRYICDDGSSYWSGWHICGTCIGF